MNSHANLHKRFMQSAVHANKRSRFKDFVQHELVGLAEWRGNFN